jgi:hypothetical protein
MLRIKIEGGHYLGFIEVQGTTTLTKVRKEISTSFDSDLVPSHYQFLAPSRLLSRQQLDSNNGGNAAVGENQSSKGINYLNDNELIPVGTRRENTFLAKLLLPSVSLLPVTESPLASGIYVDLWTCSHRFRMWALPTCEIKHLREEASRFWHLNPSDTVLVTCERSTTPVKNFTVSMTVEEAVEAAANGEGRLWPENATVHNCLAAFSKIVTSRKGTNARVICAAYKDETDSQFDNENDVGPQPVFSLRMRDPQVEKIIDIRTFRGKMARSRKEGGGGGDINDENTLGKSKSGRRQSKRASFFVGEKDGGVPTNGHYLDPDLYKEIYDVSVGGDDEDADSGSAAEDVGGASTRSLLTLGTTGRGGSRRRNLLTKGMTTRTDSSATLVPQSTSSSIINVNASIGNQLVPDNSQSLDEETSESRRVSRDDLPLPPPHLPPNTHSLSSPSLLQNKEEEKISSLISMEVTDNAPTLYSSASFSKRRSVGNATSQPLSSINYLLSSGPVSTSFILTSLAGLSLEDADFFAPFASLEPALWRTFARYAVSTGGAWSESRRLRLRQWRLMLDDGGLLSPSCATSSSSANVVSVTKHLSTEAADLIFYSTFGAEGTSTKGISGSGIDYLQFLRCLVAVSANKDPRRRSTKTSISSNGIISSSSSSSTSSTNSNNNSNSRVQKCLSILGETTVDSLASAITVVAVMLSTPAVVSGDQAKDESNNSLLLDQPSASAFLSLVKDSILPNCARFNAESWAVETDHLARPTIMSGKAANTAATSGGSKLHVATDNNALSMDTPPSMSASAFILSVFAPALRPAFSAFSLSCATSPSLAIHHAAQSETSSTTVSVAQQSNFNIIIINNNNIESEDISMDALREREKASRLSAAFNHGSDAFDGTASSSTSSPLRNPRDRLSSVISSSSPGGNSINGGDGVGGANIRPPESPLQKQIARLSLASQGLSPNSAVTRAMIGALNGGKQQQVLNNVSKKHSKRTSRSTIEPPSAALSRAYAIQVVNSRRQTLLQGAVEGGYASRQLLHQQQYAAAIPPLSNQPPRNVGGGGGGVKTVGLSRKSSAASLAGGGAGGGGVTHRNGINSLQEIERISIEDFVRFVSSLGLSTLGPKASPMPTRLIVEIALASACSEGLVSNDDIKTESSISHLSTVPSFFSTASSTSSNGSLRTTSPSLNNHDGKHPENAAIRKRSFLTFPQFLLAIGRLAIQLTDLFAAVVSPHSNVGDRLRLLPPLLRVKALLQQAAATTPSTSFTDDATAVNLVHQSSSLLRAALMSSQAADEQSSDYIGSIYELSKKLSLSSHPALTLQSQQQQQQRGGQSTLTSSNSFQEEKKGDVYEEEEDEVYNRKVARFVEGIPLPMGANLLPQNAVVSRGIPADPPQSHANQKNRVYKKQTVLPLSTQGVSKKKKIISPPIFSPRPSSTKNNEPVSDEDKIESFEERRMKLFQLEQLWQFQRQMNDVEKFLLAQRKAEAKAVSDYNRAQGGLQGGPQVYPSSHHQQQHSSSDNYLKSAETVLVGSPRSPLQQLYSGGGGGGIFEGEAIGREGFATQSSADTALSEDARLSRLKRQMLINADIERRHALWAKLLQQREATHNAISSALTVPSAVAAGRRSDEEGASPGAVGLSKEGLSKAPSPDRLESLRSSPSGVSPKGPLTTTDGGGGSSGSLAGEANDGTSPTKSEILQADLLFAYGGGFMQHMKKQQQFSSYPPNISIPKDYISSSPASQPDTRPATPSHFQSIQHSAQMSITPTIYNSSLRAASVPPSPSASTAMSLSAGVSNQAHRGTGGGGITIAPSRSPASSVSSLHNAGGVTRGGGGGLKKSSSNLSLAMMTSTSPAPSPPATVSTMTSSLPPMSSRTSTATNSVPLAVNGKWNKTDGPTTSTSPVLASTTVPTSADSLVTLKNNSTQVEAHTSEVSSVVDGPIVADVAETKTIIKASTGTTSGVSSHVPPLSPAKNSPSSVSPPSPKIPIAAMSGSLLVQHHDMITAALEARRQESRSSPSMATNLSSAEEDDDDKSSSATEEGSTSHASLHVLPRRPDFDSGGGIINYGGVERNDDESVVSTLSRTDAISNTDSAASARDGQGSSQFGSVSMVSTSGLSLPSSRSDTSQQQQHLQGGGGGGGGVRTNLGLTSSSTTTTASILPLSSPGNNTAFSPVIPQTAASKLSSPSITLSGERDINPAITPLVQQQQQQQQGQGQRQNFVINNNSKPIVSGTKVTSTTSSTATAVTAVPLTFSNSNTTIGKVITNAAALSGGGGGGEGAAVESDPQTREMVARRLVLKRMMQTGATFLKFGRQGFPHSRIIWLTEDLSALRWRKPGTPMPDSASSRDLTNSDSGILVNDIADILKGSVAEGAPQTAVFKRNAARVTNGALCLSVVTKSGTRTLDLECESVSMADDWALGLLSLKRFRSLL